VNTTKHSVNGAYADPLTILRRRAINSYMLRGEVRVYRYSYRYATHGTQAVARA
jgi:hypothetical protein